MPDGAVRHCADGGHAAFSDADAEILRRYAGCFALRRGLHPYHSAGVSVPHYEYRHEQADSGRRQPALFHDVDAHRRTYQYGP